MVFQLRAVATTPHRFSMSRTHQPPAPRDNVPGYHMRACGSVGARMSRPADETPRQAAVTDKPGLEAEWDADWATSSLSPPAFVTAAGPDFSVHVKLSPAAAER